MQQVGEFVIAEWVIPEILDDRSAVSIGVSLLDFVVRRMGESFYQRRADVSSVGNVNEFFVRQHGVALKGL